MQHLVSHLARMIFVQGEGFFTERLMRMHASIWNRMPFTCGAGIVALVSLPPPPPPRSSLIVKGICHSSNLPPALPLPPSPSHCGSQQQDVSLCSSHGGLRPSPGLHLLLFCGTDACTQADSCNDFITCPIWLATRLAGCLYSCLTGWLAGWLGATQWVVH